MGGEVIGLIIPVEVCIVGVTSPREAKPSCERVTSSNCITLDWLVSVNALQKKSKALGPRHTSFWQSANPGLSLLYTHIKGTLS